MNETKFSFTPHSQKQEDLILSDTDLTISGTGTQWGKSLSGSIWIKRQIHTYTDREDSFLLMAPTYKIMNQSMEPYFLRVMEGCGKYHKSESLFEMSDRRKVYLRTETDPDSIVGIPRVRAYWLDEANKVSLYFHENIQSRAASIGARGLYTTSPYSRNWLYKDYIKPSERCELPGVKLIRAASWENPYHSLANPECRQKMMATMDPRRFEMLFGGEWGKQAGLVYDCWDDDQNQIESFRLPNGTIFVGGIDWGHTEPFVFVVRAITPDNMHYQVSEFYKTGMTVPDQMEIVKRKCQTFGVKRVFCGHERPENIMLFVQNGIPASGVPEKDIQVGTDLHYELIKTRRYKIFATQGKTTSPYTLDEMESYHYPEPEDLKPDDDSADQKPVGQNDHCMSANRFVTLKTYKSGQKNRPYVPEDGTNKPTNEDQEAKFKRLMRNRRYKNQHTETWD